MATRYYVLLLALVCIGVVECLWGEASLEKVWSGAGVLPLTEDLSGVELSPENRATFIDNPAVWAQEAKRNQAIFEQRIRAWLWLGGSLLGALFFSGGGIAIYKWLGQAQSKPSITPRLKALKALAQLKRLIQPQGRVASGGRGAAAFNQLMRHSYTASADIMRTYIEECYHVPAFELTTQEFLQHNVQFPIFDAAEADALKELLRQSDLVKFALLTPSQKECQQALQVVQTFVEQENGNIK